MFRRDYDRPSQNDINWEKFKERKTDEKREQNSLIHQRGADKAGTDLWGRDVRNYPNSQR